MSGSGGQKRKCRSVGLMSALLLPAQSSFRAPVTHLGAAAHRRRGIEIRHFVVAANAAQVGRIPIKRSAQVIRIPGKHSRFVETANPTPRTAPSDIDSHLIHPDC
jgi:hypothetical protein